MHGGFIQTDDGRLCYEVSGKGHLLILLHAGSMDRRMWDKQIPIFSERYQVIRYDARGMGKSDAPSGSFSNYKDLDLLFNELDITQAHLVGLSLGGRTALDFSIAYPQKVAGLILTGTGICGRPFSKQYVQKIIMVVSAIQQGTIDSMDASFWQKSFLAVTNDDPELIKKIKRLLVDNAKYFDIDPTFLRELDPPAYQRLQEVDVPVLNIAGTQDCEDPDW